FTRVRSQTDRCLQGRIGLGKPGRSVIGREIDLIVGAGQPAVGKIKVRITSHGFLKEACRFVKVIRALNIKDRGSDEGVSLGVKTVGSKIAGWYFLDGRLC